MILIEKEPEDLFDEFGVYENCHFCKEKTDTWHSESNTPICAKCSQIHNSEELNNKKDEKKLQTSIE